jgi:hypothetical protein
VTLADYTALILHQHRNKTKFVDTVSTPIEMLIEWADELETAVEKIDIDNAEAPYLDVVGEWIGRPRALIPNGPITDALYQLVLRSKIIKNHWDGSIDQLYEMWDSIFSPDLKIIVQEIGLLRIMIALLGPPVDLLYSTIASPLLNGPWPVDMETIHNIVVGAVVEVDGTPIPTAIYNARSELHPATVTIAGLTTDIPALSIYVARQITTGDPPLLTYYNFLSNMTWAEIEPLLEISGIELLATGAAAWALVGTDYVLTMPSGWVECPDVPGIIWTRPPVMTSIPGGFSRVTSAELRMLRSGQIVPKPAGVKVVEYLTLPADGKILAWDLQNEYFEGIGDLATGAGGGLIALEIDPTGNGPIFDWILDAGVWNDMGEQVDENVWRDAP